MVQFLYVCVHASWRFCQLLCSMGLYFSTNLENVGTIFSLIICLCPHLLFFMMLMIHILHCLLWSHCSFFVYIYQPFHPLYFCLRVFHWICLQVQMFSYVFSNLLSISIELFFCSSFKFLNIFTIDVWFTCWLISLSVLFLDLFILLIYSLCNESCFPVCACLITWLGVKQHGFYKCWLLRIYHYS